MIEKQSPQVVSDNRPKLPVNLGPINPAKKYSGFIIVRLSATVPVTDDKALIDLAKRYGLNGLGQILEKYKLSSTSRVVQSLPPQEILQLERRAAQTKYPPLHSLTAYWRIRVERQQNEIDEILRQLNGLKEKGQKEVDIAYRELAASAPTINDIDDPLSGSQTYLDAAPVGIGARWVWKSNQLGGGGDGIGFIDLEGGWSLSHEDLINDPPLLAPPFPQIIYGNNKPIASDGGEARNHGTAVLGIVIGTDNTVGIIGIAPKIASARLVSHYHKGFPATRTTTAIPATEGNIADGIAATLSEMNPSKLNPGDILLLEVQRYYEPTEVDAADWDAIRLVSSKGIIVIEAAGNGNHELGSGLKPKQDGSGFESSGAIMVGSSVSGLPHNRYVGLGEGWGSNFGSRVDCYAWGENITTAGYGDLVTTGRYTTNFGGTSGASAIIAGAALIVQGIYAAKNHGPRLLPEDMRRLLSDPATGTAQGTGVPGNIGVMPNLKAIIPAL